MLAKFKNFLLENKAIKQTILKNAFWLAFGQIVGRLIRAVIIIYAARILGAESYGVFSYAISLVALFTILTDLGVNGILTREVAKTPELKLQYFSTTFFIKIIFLIFSFLIIIFITPFFTKIKSVTVLIPFITIILAADAIRDFGIAFFRALEKMEIEAGILIFTNTAVVIFSLITLMFAPTNLNLMIGYAIGSGSGALMTIWILKKQFYRFLIYFKKELIMPIITAAWPFALGGVLSAFMINTDIIMIGWFRNATEVGFYSIAQRSIQLLYLPTALIATSYFPILARFIKNNNKEKTQLILEKALAAVFLIAFPLTIGGMIVSKELIDFIYGSQYQPSLLSFQILLPTLLLVYPGTIIGNAVFAFDKQKLFLILILLGASGNIILNATLIPLYGIVGAAIATVLAQLLSNSFIWWKMKKINNFEVIKNIKKIILASILMGVLTIALKSLNVNFLLNLTLSAISYFAILHALKEKIVEDFKKILGA